jgi:hypothetical protein
MQVEFMPKAYTTLQETEMRPFGQLVKKHGFRWCLPLGKLSIVVGCDARKMLCFCFVETFLNGCVVDTSKVA